MTHQDRREKRLSDAQRLWGVLCAARHNHPLLVTRAAKQLINCGADGKAGMGPYMEPLFKIWREAGCAKLTRGMRNDDPSLPSRVGGGLEESRVQGNLLGPTFQNDKRRSRMRKTFVTLYAFTALAAVIGAALFSGCDNYASPEEAMDAAAFFSSPAVQAKINALVEAGEGTPCGFNDIPGPYDVMFLHTVNHDPTQWSCRKLNVTEVKIKLIPNLAAFGAASDNSISWVRMGIRTHLAMAKGVNPGGFNQWNPNTDFCTILAPLPTWARVMAERVGSTWMWAQACQSAGFTSVTDGASSLIAWTD